MKKVIIYTDGACKGNPGTGGWAAVLTFNGVKKEIYGAEKNTTNNKMELTAVIKALESLKEPCEVLIHSDSKYFCDAITKGWLKNWEKSGWKKSDGKPVLNIDLWKRLMFLLNNHKVDISWVKGHAGNTYNERCDYLATNAAKNLMI